MVVMHDGGTGRRRWIREKQKMSGSRTGKLPSGDDRFLSKSKSMMSKNKLTSVRSNPFFLHRVFQSQAGAGAGAGAGQTWKRRSKLRATVNGHARGSLWIFCSCCGPSDDDALQ